MALAGCSVCGGSAVTPDGAVCKCVDRRVFRVCYERYRFCTVGGQFVRGRRNIEYVADFAILSKRTLEVEAQRQRHNWGRDVYPLWNIFRLHYLSGADWKVCCRQLKMDRGSFFHAVYRIEAALGRAYRETQPFSLYPPKEYFQRKPHGETVAPFPAKEEPRFQPLRPPLAPKRPRRVRTIEAPVEVPKRARVRSKLAA